MYSITEQGWSTISQSVETKASLSAKEARNRQGIQGTSGVLRKPPIDWDKMSFPDYLQQEMVVRLILFGENCTE